MTGSNPTAATWKSSSFRPTGRNCATERIWNYMRKYVTHNRFFEKPQDLCDALFSRFDYVRHHPQEIEDLLNPFF